MLSALVLSAALCGAPQAPDYVLVPVAPRRIVVRDYVLLPVARTVVVRRTVVPTRTVIRTAPVVRYYYEPTYVPLESGFYYCPSCR